MVGKKWETVALDQGILQIQELEASLGVGGGVLSFSPGPLWACDVKKSLAKWAGLCECPFFKSQLEAVLGWILKQLRVWMFKELCSSMVLPGLFSLVYFSTPSLQVCEHIKMCTCEYLLQVCGYIKMYALNWYFYCLNLLIPGTSLYMLLLWLYYSF